ncbi:MAG: hypothetical protein K9J25_13855 [Bacteroidales bacterium]|nr:hypothetical protein [Bacteroidales bacterium]
MKKIYKLFTVGLLMTIPFLTSCEKEIPNENNDDNPQVETPDEISQFVFEGLKDVYLWYDKVDKFADGYFATNEDYYTYLNNFGTDYEGLFYDLLYEYGSIDKWSWIVDDYEALENSFAGISTSMGYDFRLVRLSESDDIFGYIRYVLPDSPAEGADLERGNLFMEVDGQQLTIDNYRDILINNESYSLSLASITNNVISLTGEVTPVMNAVELQENPVYYSEIMDIGGVSTAYLVYNSFTSNFDTDLNAEFEYYKTQGVQRLILDLRYNGGGSIRTSTYLASMIYGTNTNDIFTKSVWNDKYNDYFIANYGEDYLNYYFKDVISATDETAEVNIASLELSEIYFITTGATASASELVINGLIPYMDVHIIGTNSTGKYVGSITVKDWDEQGNVNPKHKWAMQPITLKLANVDGVSDYVNGLDVDLEATEDYANLLPFGDPDEPLLKAVKDYILGTKSATFSRLVEGVDYEVIADSRDFKPLSKEMYLEGDFPFLK